MRAIVFAAALAAMPVAAQAEGACTQEGAEQYIREASAAWADSVASHDASVVQRILADDFVGVTPKGTVYGKQQMVTWTAGPGPYVANKFDGVSIRFFGMTAVAQGSETWTKNDGTPGRWVWMDTWVCRNGTWQIVAAVDVVAPVAATPAPQ